MSKMQRNKGYRAENEFAKLIKGKRIPLSGACDGFKGDVEGLSLIWEVKIRKDGFKELYKWLEGKDALAIRANKQKWLVVIPLDKFIEFFPELYEESFSPIE